MKRIFLMVAAVVAISSGSLSYSMKNGKTENINEQENNIFWAIENNKLDKVRELTANPNFDIDQIDVDNTYYSGKDLKRFLI